MTATADGQRSESTRSEQPVAVEEASLALVELTLAALASENNISLLQLRLLLVVDRHSPVNVSVLATRLDVSVPSASRLVDRLVEANLVDRRAAEHSRREVALSLTPDGRRALGRLRRSRRRAISGVLREMTAQERAALVLGLTAFAGAADAHQVDPGPGQ